MLSRFAVCLHAGLHGEDAGVRMVAEDTAASAIVLADWFAGEQLRILERGRHAARRAKCDEVLELLTDNPRGITARDVHRARIVGNADEARALLAQMEADGELTGTDYKPETGGHITRTLGEGFACSHGCIFLSRFRVHCLHNKTQIHPPLTLLHNNSYATLPQLAHKFFFTGKRNCHKMSDIIQSDNNEHETPKTI